MTAVQELSRMNAATKQPIFAALDLGTNNCRLMIATEDNGRLRIINSFSNIVRLGEGLSASGELSDAAMERAINALKLCAHKLAYYDITEAHYVATEACRKAKNGREFAERVRTETGIKLNIISEKDEATLAFLGCSPLVASSTDYVIMLDIGGGSTEMMMVDVRDALSPKTMACRSFPVGVMSVTETESAAQCDETTFRNLVDRLKEKFQEFVQAQNLKTLSQAYDVQMICCSGTITTVGAIHKKLKQYERREVDGLELSRKQIDKVIDGLLKLPPHERGSNPCVGPERAEFLLAGCGILKAAYELIPTDAITVADRGVREGILLSLFQKHQSNAA